MRKDGPRASVQQWNSPTQAKRGLEWATRPGKGLLQGEAVMTGHAATQAARGVTAREVAEALSHVPKGEAARGSVLRFIGTVAEVRVNRVTGTIVTVIRFSSPGAASKLP